MLIFVYVIDMAIKSSKGKSSEPDDGMIPNLAATDV